MSKTASDKPNRRAILQLVPSVTLASAAAATSGCAALLGEETIEAYVMVYPSDSGTFWGWTEYNMDDVPEDQGATLERVLLRVPENVGDLRFVTSLLAEAVTPTARTEVARGGDFPANDTMAPLEITYDGDLQPLIDRDNQKIRIEWSGTMDTSYPIPEEGIRVDALIVIEVL